MPAKKTKRVVVSNEDIALLGITYVNKKDAIKELEAQCKECRKPLEDYIETSGRVLDSGSKLAVVSHADVDVHLKKTLRVTKALTPEAVDVLSEAGLDECIEQVPVVREDILESLYMAGKVPDEVLKKVYVGKSNYAFSVEIKEKFHE